MMSNAMSIFEIGDRVVMSASNPRLAPQSRYRGSRWGVVVGYGREPQLIRVHRDGAKSPETWLYTFWEHETMGVEQSMQDCRVVWAKGYPEKLSALRDKETR